MGRLGARSHEAHGSASGAAGRSTLGAAAESVQNAHGMSVGRNSRLKRMDRTVRRWNVELADAKLELKRGSERRKALGSALEKSDKHHGQMLLKSRRMQESLRLLSREILSAQEQERKKISRELHDQIGQTLTAINVQLATLKREASVPTHDLRKTIGRIQRLVERSMNTVHRFARELRPPVLDDLGLIPALHAHMKAFTKRTGIPIQFRAFAAVERADSDRRTALYRVAQEALSNIGKHAHATFVKVDITKEKGHVRMEVHDNGKSFDVRRLAARTIVRLGLLGMQERMEMVGGTFEIESEPGKGTTVRAQVPLRPFRTPSSARRVVVR